MKRIGIRRVLIWVLISVFYNFIPLIPVVKIFNPNINITSIEYLVWAIYLVDVTMKISAFMALGQSFILNPLMRESMKLNNGIIPAIKLTIKKADTGNNNQKDQPVSDQQYLANQTEAESIEKYISKNVQNIAKCFLLLFITNLFIFFLIFWGVNNTTSEIMNAFSVDKLIWLSVSTILLTKQYLSYTESNIVKSLKRV